LTNPVDPQRLKAAWFQPLNLKRDILVSTSLCWFQAFAFSNGSTRVATAWLAKGAQYRWLFGGQNSVVGYVAVSVAAHTVGLYRLNAVDP
jgi:hypothetical protein